MQNINTVSSCQFCSSVEMSAEQLFQIFLRSESERIRQLRMRALIHQRISALARQRAKRLTMIYLATIARERSRKHPASALHNRSRGPIVFLDREMPKLSEEDFVKQFHISRSSFHFILNNLSFLMSKKESLKLIPVWKQIATSLYALTSTESFKTVGVIFGIDSITVSIVLLEFCSAIVQIFQEQYMKSYPPSAEGITAIRKGFEELSGLPQVYGAVGDFRVDVKISTRNMRSPVKILAAADYRRKFTYVEVGAPSDRANLFEKSCLKDYHKCNKLFYSMSRKLVDGSVPIFLAGDASFQLQPYLMTPFQHADLSPREHDFNAALLKAHQCVEDAFAMMRQRFPRLGKCKNIAPDNLPLLVKAACIMHNILIEREDVSWDFTAAESTPVPPLVPMDEDGMGMRIRDEIANALMSCQ
ncbi:putative nuclease HARBI1 [Phlebotomus argentipes]|uniref:putative nuclease HARBI1 n=1 Tax=Phlebotomus argentipes TaxID=94469 RepID=UPI002893563B|nr:putative nuclease HARBI1 [Phlebotomus argentipes]